MKTVYKYIEFEQSGESKGEPAYVCRNRKHSEMLGWATWEAAWSQYVFWALSASVIFSATCLEDIADFLKQLNAQEE